MRIKAEKKNFEGHCLSPRFWNLCHQMNANARLCTIPYLYLAIGVLGVRNSQYSATSLSSNNETLHSARAWRWKQDEIFLNCALYCTLIWHSLTFAIQFLIVLNNWHINKCLWLLSCLLFYYKKRNALFVSGNSTVMCWFCLILPTKWYKITRFFHEIDIS